MLATPNPVPPPAPCRIVEIRSCTPGPALVVDWGSNHDSVIVTGNAIFEGNMAFKGK